MSYRLVVAEKPSVGAAYTKVLGATNRLDGYWEGNGYLVSWCIDDILDELNLTTYKERHPMSLSGGQKQRTAIGVAALRDAEVLIFDEPTSGLDYKNMESVAEILSALSKRGKAILVISHDNELLMKICSRVIRVDERASS